MSLRKIRPAVDENTSSSNPTGSGVSNLRRSGRGPTDTAATTTTTESSSSAKRRRVPESVTPNACLSCKKARAKVHIKHAKEELVKQITELKAKNHISEQIFAALVHDDRVPEMLDRLRSNEPHESIAEWLGRSPREEGPTPSPQISHHSLAATSDYEMEGVAPSTAFRWTTVTPSTIISDHLFQLYFAWVHPVNTLFSEGRFVESYNSHSDAYCSTILVNAICAMACLLHSGVDSDVVDFEDLAGDFSDAVRANIDIQDRRLTTTQALAVMFLFDTARANSLRASAYLRIASENLISIAGQDTDGFHEVCRDTICGIRNLSVEWAQVTFQPPPSIETAKFERFSESDERYDGANWHFYRFIGDSCPAWPSLLATVNRQKSRLLEIVSDIVITLYCPQEPRLSAHHVLELYGRLVTWRVGLPGILGDVDDNSSQPLPHVLSLLILYHSSTIQLLRPLLDHDDFPSALIEDVVWTHAQQGLDLLESYYLRLYTCRYQPVSQMFAVLHLTDVVARFFPGAAHDGGSKKTARGIHFGIDVLNESRPGFPIAARLWEMLRRTATDICMPLGPSSDAFDPATPPPPVFSTDDFIDACTRPTYMQPIAYVHRRYLPGFGQDWARIAPRYGFREMAKGLGRLRVPSAEEIGAQRLMQIGNLLNNS